MKKWKLLPKLAVKGVVQNGSVYFPYIMAGIFSVFTYFIFASILCNDIMKTLPKSAYAWMLLSVGKVLLGVILLPFMIYAGSFLIKRRKKEIGLYSILGLEKRHIGFMLLIETIVVYGVVTAGGIITGTVFAKLLFLLLLNMSGLPVDVEFVFYPAAFKETVIYFAIVYLINYVNNLIQVGKSKPVELLSGSKKGEKELKGIWIYAALGVAGLGWGYAIAIRSQMDSMIFTNFFLAVFFVVVGTYFLFTSGSVAFLKLLKKRKGIYYKPANFITISGMLYRMKKNAASLVNICIFSTMVIITLVCTVSLYAGREGINRFDYPYDVQVDFMEGSMEPEAVEQKVKELEQKYGLKAQREDIFDKLVISMGKSENQFHAPGQNFQDNYRVSFLTLEDYNRIEGQTRELSEGQIFLYSSGENFGYSTVKIMEEEIPIAEEITELFQEPKAEIDTFGESYFLVVKDRAARERYVKIWAEANGVEDVEGFLNSGSKIAGLVLEGKDEGKEDFVNDFITWSKGQPGFTSYNNGLEGRAEISSMNGGLLFIGIIFSLIFFMCLILIMYYKQIAEGYEDRSSFSIMQKVGMSDREIKSTVHRQILLVFFVPLFGALLHTTAGMFMVERLMATLRFFNTPLLIGTAVAIVLLFSALYGISYAMTAKTYYKIVR